MRIFAHSWILKIGISCFWLFTGLFIAKLFYIEVSFYYLRDLITSLGGHNLLETFLETKIASTNLLEVFTLFACFLQIMVGFYVLIYPPYAPLIGVQIFLVLPIFAFALADPTLFYHPFGVVSKSICVLAALIVLRQGHLQKEENHLRKILLGSLMFLWFYEGIVHCFFQTPFELSLVQNSGLADFWSPLLKGIGVFQIFSCLILYPLYFSRLRNLAHLLIIIHFCLMIAMSAFYLYKVLYYLYHPLGPFTKNFVIGAIYLYLLSDPMDEAT